MEQPPPLQVFLEGLWTSLYGPDVFPWMSWCEFIAASLLPPQLWMGSTCLVSHWSIAVVILLIPHVKDTRFSPFRGARRTEMRTSSKEVLQETEQMNG